MFGMFVKLLDKWEFIKSPNSDLPSHFHNTITKIDTLITTVYKSEFLIFIFVRISKVNWRCSY